MAASRRQPPAATLVAEVCLYGTARTGAGYLGNLLPHGQSFGDGETRKARSFTDAVALAQDEVRRLGVKRGVMRIIDAGGDRVSYLDVNEACWFGDLTWGPAPAYEIAVAIRDALMHQTFAQ